MARTSNIFARVEPEIKEQAEFVLEQLGVPMSNAIGIFLRQIIMHQGIPFDMKLPQKQPLVYSSLTEDEFNSEIQKGLSDINAGNLISSENIIQKIQKDYKIYEQ